MQISNRRSSNVKLMSSSYFLLIAAILCTVIALSGCAGNRPGTSSAADPSTLATTTLSLPTPTPIPLEPYAFDIADFSIVETLDGNQYTIQRIQLGSDGELIITTDASTNTGMYGSLSTLSLVRDNVKERSFDTSFGSPGYYKNAYVTINNELKEIKLTAISREKLYDREIILYDYIDDAGNVVSKITLPNNIILFNKTEEMNEDNNYADSALYSDACIFVGSEIRAFTDAKVVEIKDETGSVKSFLIKAKTVDGQYLEFEVDKEDAFFHKEIDGTEDYSTMLKCSGFEDSYMYLNDLDDKVESPLIGHITDVYIGDDLIKLVSYTGGDFYYGSSTRATFKTIGSSTSLSGAVPDGISDIKSMVSYLSDRFETVGSGDGKTFKLNGIPYCYTTFSNCDTITPIDNKIVCTAFLDGSNLTTENGWIVINDEQADIVSSNVNLYNDSTNQSILFSNYAIGDDNYIFKFLGYKIIVDDFGNENIMFIKELKDIKRSTTKNQSYIIPSDSVLINNTELSYFQNSETFDCIYDSQDVA